MSGENILDIENLCVRMGEQTILNDVSVRVPAGGIVTVLGSNGVGKTTLMRGISGVYRSTSGSIRFDGGEITNWPSHKIVAAGLAQAPEGRQIFSSMTIAENLRVGGVGLSPEALAEEENKQLQRFPILRDRYRQKAGTLSGGEQQGHDVSSQAGADGRAVAWSGAQSSQTDLRPDHPDSLGRTLGAAC